MTWRSLVQRRLNGRGHKIGPIQNPIHAKSRENGLRYSPDRLSASLGHIERRAARRLALGIERDLLHLRLDAPEKLLAMGAQRLATLIQRDGRLQLDIAPFQLGDD